MRIVAIIQARVQSSRLPGKVLLPLKQRPVINHIIDRLNYSDKLTDIILAIPEDEENTVLRKLALSAGVDYVAGPLEDVLTRYIKAVETSEADVIVRITGDSPLISPYIVDVTVEALQEQGFDYAVTLGTPLGVEAEVLSRDAFDRVVKFSTEPELREHATLAVYRNPGAFNVRLLSPPEGYNRPDLRLTLDTKQDYILLKSIYDNVEPDRGLIQLPDVFKYLDANPDLVSVNKNVEQRLHDFLVESKEAMSHAGSPDRATFD